MDYPGHSVQKNEPDKAVVTAIQQQLNKKGCGPITADGDFGDKTTSAVKLFQSRFADIHGHPLTIDGVIGPVTWATLFQVVNSSITTPPNDLLAAVLNAARTKIGVMEVPPGSNDGPDVHIFQATVGLHAGDSWCMAFVYWCFNQASASLGRTNPMYKTGGVLDEWAHTKGTKILAANAQVNTSLVQPGQIFIISTGGGHGHTGMVEKIDAGLLTTIEGNTNTNGSSNGVGVFRRTARTINSINEGFIQFA